MTWPTDGPNADGWEDPDATTVITDPEPIALPATFRARWFDPSKLGGLGNLLASVSHQVGNVAVEARQRGSRLEVTLTRREIRGVALLDSFDFEVLEGLPCSVVVTVYDDDAVTPIWEVSTDPEHVAPYLVEPDDYGEQELDVAKGSASIGTVRVTIVDRRQIAGDQDSGWMTDKLAEGGFAALAGRRVRVVRFIEPEIGYQVIADGPAGTPQMDQSYAAFSFTVRDTRETERKSRLTRGGDRTILPFGVRNGYGFDGATYLIDPANLLTATVTADPLAGDPYTDWGNIEVRLEIGGNPVADRTLPVESFEALDNVAHLPQYQNNSLGGLSFAYYTLIPVDAVLEYRAAGSGDPFTRVGLTGQSGDDPAVVMTQIILVGETLQISRLQFTAAVGLGAFIGTDIEFRILGGRGTISTGLPFYLEGITAGELVRNAYDGEYSDLDAQTGATVPTGIRYDEAALLQMTDPVRLRLFDPVDDLRKWLEEKIFAPTGWIPALDFDGRVSPVSQVPPADSGALDAITDAIAEPAPEWNAGETIYNVVRFTYPRDYRPTDPEVAESADGLADRDVVVEFEDPVSVQRQGRKVLELDGVAFRAIGDPDAAPAESVEVGGTLALARGTYMLNRYSLGAPTMQLAVMRRELPLLRAGDFVVVSLSWFPDYVTDRRGLLAVAQVVALNDLDCAWRRVTLEVVALFPES